MTEQYGQRNINNPEGSRTEANTVADPDFTMTAADTGKMVIFTTTLVGVATLPNAAEAGAGAQVTIVAATGGAFSLEVPSSPDGASSAGVADLGIMGSATPAFISRKSRLFTGWFCSTGGERGRF